MKKKSLALVMLLMLSLLLSACGGSSMESANSGSAAFDKVADAAPMESAEMSVESPMSSVNSDIYNDTGNKIIRTASLHIQTTDFDASVSALGSLTEANGGYYETAEVQGGGYYDTYARRSAYYVVRIPKENFTAFLNGAGGIGHLYSIVEGTDDVGEVYYDTEARLATLTTKRDRLLALLEEATEMEDIITLEDALSDVTYEIEMHTASLRKYDSLINYSTFTISINEVVRIVEEPGPEDSFGVKLMSNLKEGFTRFGENLQDFVLWVANNLIGLVVFAAIIVVAVIVVRRQIRRRRAKRYSGE